MSSGLGQDSGRNPKGRSQVFLRSGQGQRQVHGILRTPVKIADTGEPVELL